MKLITTMEEDHEQEELIQSTDEDDDSSSDSEESCLHIHKHEETQSSSPQLYTTYTKTEFLVHLFLVIFSATCLVILLPMYIETVNVKSDVYSLLQFTVGTTTFILCVAELVCKFWHKQHVTVPICKPPAGWATLFKLAAVYCASGFLVVYALDRKRVVCHIQDPIKGITLVFSLIYYFFFCRKLMGLRSIFCTTTIIVGLFISVDYGLCDEFRCRGLDRESRVDDSGPWTWKTHVIWTTVYICGLALFSAFYTLLERCLVHSELGQPTPATGASLFLATVSRLVWSRDSPSAFVNSQIISELTPATSVQGSRKSPSVQHLVLWLHFIVLVLTFCFFWIDIVPNVGKPSSIGEFYNYSKNSLCHFAIPGSEWDHDCGHVSGYAWLFVLAYILYILSSIRLLIMSQSSVFVIAASTVALPLVGIWWSLYRILPGHPGVLEWSPSINGELICAVLGLPIVIPGLLLLTKTHFRESGRSDTACTSQLA